MDHYYINLLIYIINSDAKWLLVIASILVRTYTRSSITFLVLIYIRLIYISLIYISIL